MNRLLNYQIFIPIVLLALCLSSCIKPEVEEDPLPSDEPNWEVIQNFPQGDSYEFLKLAYFDDRPFVTTYGHYGISAGASGSLHEFKGSFFYLLPDGWRVYRSTNEAIVNIKVFNNQLYGITERKTPYTMGGVQTYQHTYFLFKWVDNNFVNLDTLEFTDKNMISKSSLNTPILWENDDKLYLIAYNTNTVYSWELSSGQFIDYKDVLDISYKTYCAKDNKQIAFTGYNQLNDDFQRTDIVKGYYYDGSTVETSDTYTFTKRHDGTFSNAFDFYAAANGSLYGYVDSLLKNIVTEAEVKKMSPESVFSISNIGSINGKLYSIIGNKQLSCEVLGIYNGQSYSEIPYRLPAPLDECSKIVDVIEAGGSTYMVLLNRWQYVVVKSL